MSELHVEVCKVEAIEKHPNADKLSIVTVKGWNCIVGLDQYKVNDLVVFVPPDCIIPNELIEKYKLEYLKGNRTKTVKLRGFVSQGLILNAPIGSKAGKDVAKDLGVTKWEPPVNPVMRGKISSKKKSNPLFDKYTEIENIKNFNWVFKVGDVVVVTEKIHGCNARYGNLPIYISGNNLLDKLIGLYNKYITKRTHELVYGSHNVQLTFGGPKHWKKGFYKENVWEEVGHKYKFNLPENCILYGEIYGGNIQDLTYGFKDYQFRAFDVKLNGKYLGFDDLVDFCLLRSIPLVPMLYRGPYYEGLLEELTSGKSLICPTQIREGIVIKSIVEETDRVVGRKVLKSISADYLMRKNGSEYK